MRSDLPSHVRTGGELLVDQLLAEGIHLGFCVPGETATYPCLTLCAKHVTTSG